MKNQENQVLISSILENDIISQILKNKNPKCISRTNITENSIVSSTDWLEMIKNQSIILSKALSYKLIVKFSKSINGRMLSSKKIS